MKKSDKKSNSPETKSTTEVNWKKLRKQIRKVQTSNRYEHTLGVEYTAAALAMRYGANMEEILFCFHLCIYQSHPRRSEGVS